MRARGSPMEAPAVGFRDIKRVKRKRGREYRDKLINIYCKEIPSKEVKKKV